MSLLQEVSLVMPFVVFTLKEQFVVKCWTKNGNSSHYHIRQVTSHAQGTT